MEKTVSTQREYGSRAFRPDCACSATGYPKKRHIHTTPKCARFWEEFTAEGLAGAAEGMGRSVGERSSLIAKRVRAYLDSSTRFIR